MKNMIGKKRDRYRKMPLKIKILFLKRVLEEGQSIKKVSAEYKINYSTAKTLIRNEKLKKGKLQLSEINFQSCCIDNEPTQVGEQEGIVCTYKNIEIKQIDSSQLNNPKHISKIEIISRVSFPSCSNS